MASNSGQGGIQQLLAAEHEAQAIVNAAKNGNGTDLRLLFLHVVCHDVISFFVHFVFSIKKSFIANAKAHA